MAENQRRVNLLPTSAGSLHKYVHCTVVSNYEVDCRMSEGVVLVRISVKHIYLTVLAHICS